MESLEKKRSWIKVQSEIPAMDGKRREIPVALAEDGKARALAFFDIDETLASLSFIAKPAIHKLFPEVEPEGL